MSVVVVVVVVMVGVPPLTILARWLLLVTAATTNSFQLGWFLSLTHTQCDMLWYATLQLPAVHCSCTMLCCGPWVDSRCVATA